MILRVNKRYALLGVAVVLAPFAAGCGPSAVAYLSDSNSRLAYMVNEAPAGHNGGFDDPSVSQGVAAATINADGTTANYDIEADEVHSMTGLTHVGGGLYTGPSGFAQVMAIADVDQNGTADDTFLVFSQNNPASTQRTEYTMAYHGTRADPAFVQTLRTNNHTATYTGGGAFRGALGNSFIDMAGDLTMTVDFGGNYGSIDGTINNLTNNGAPPPVPIDELTFDGSLATTDPTTDFTVVDVALKHGGTAITTAGQTDGVGSFFGPRAGGTIGVYTYSGNLTPAADPTTPGVNLLGSFHGSTVDNN